jgi:EAL domain-containing protein (putative c-di-GMP-specific phosphodiesterase class I)
VLREACAAAAGWPEDVTVAVNLSPVQFKNRNLVHHVTGALSESGLAPHRLEIEVTESLLLSDSDLTIKILHQLRKLGVRISMDDFGTGYSALSHLRSFPFDKIKIDRSFVQALSSEGDGTAIVKAMIGLGRSLGVATAAEGVETESQLELIRRQGCTEAQGFLFSPPLPAQAVSRLFAAASPRAALGPQRRSGS